MKNISISGLYNGRVSIYNGYSNSGIPQGYNDPNFVTRHNGDPRTNKISTHINAREELGTVEAIQSMLGVHEWYAHIIKRLAFESDKSMAQKNAEHQFIYKIQRAHPTFRGLAPFLQQEIIFRATNHPSKW